LEELVDCADFFDSEGNAKKMLFTGFDCILPSRVSDGFMEDSGQCPPKLPAQAAQSAVALGKDGDPR
jgi:hypothetical protein